MPIDASTQLSVTLTAEQWNVALEVLQSGPYRMVAPLIQSIATQVQQGAAETMPKANGRDRLVQYADGHRPGGT